MNKTVSKLALITLLLALPLLAFAGDKNKKSTNSGLAAQIEQKLTGVAPNTVIVVVDESTNTAFLRGNVSSQAEMDRITEMLRSVQGVRVVGTNLTVAGQPSTTGVATSVATDPRSKMTTTTSKITSTGDHSTTTSVGEPSDRTRTATGITGAAGTTTTSDPATASGMSGEKPPDTANDPHAGHEMATSTETMTSDDASLTARVEEALSKEGITGQSKVRVDTKNGVVTVTGTALSQAHADRIVALAQSVQGVKDVESNLRFRDGRRHSYEEQPSDERNKKGRQIEEGETGVSQTGQDDDDE